MIAPPLTVQYVYHHRGANGRLRAPPSL